VRSAENIEKIVKNLNLDIDTNAQTDQAVLNELLDAQKKSMKQQSAYTLPNIGRFIMKSPMTKLAAAAVIVAAVLIVISQLGGSGTSVVWAEVAQKVQDSRGVIFRGKELTSDLQDDGPDYIMNYLASTQARHDYYKADQIIKTFYDDYNKKTVVLIDHVHNSYIKRTVENMEQNDLWINPKSLIQKFLSHETRNLGRKAIEGILCEGIETTDPTFYEASFPVNSLMARIWVSVKTGYPISLEFEVSCSIEDNEKMHIKVVADQFQWDVELDESIFEPNIPPDYIDISP
jgi:outer membrane lipoprotein-sorting protein